MGIFWYIPYVKIRIEDKNHKEKKMTHYIDYNDPETVILSQDYPLDEPPCKLSIDACRDFYLGLLVVHKTYGTGIIAEINDEGNIVTVMFGDLEKRFLLPDAFKKHLCFKKGRRSISRRKLAAEYASERRKLVKEGMQETAIPESSPYFKAIEKEMHEKIVALIGDHRHIGYCHLYWGEEKTLLRDEYGIEWKSPAELNPHVLYD